MKSETFQRSFLLLLVIAVTGVFLWMIRPFLITLLLGAIFASLARPLYIRFLGYTRGRKSAASGLALLVFFLVILLPALGFVGIVANEAVKVTETVTPWVQEKMGNKADLEKTLRRLPGFKYVSPHMDQVVSKAGTAVSGLGNSFFKGASALTAGTFIFFVNFAIMLYAMFFFFIDGPAIIDKILYYMPLDHRDEKKLLNGFQSMARATIKSIVVIGAMQGFLAGLSFWAAGIPSPLFWGTVMAVMSIVPNVGAAIIWLPACIYLFVQGQTWAAIGVFLWCAFVVGTSDNLLRPILIGKDTAVPELLIFLSTIGGLALFGLEGFIIGPGIALLFLTVWDIYGAAFKDVLPNVGDI